MYLLLIQDGNAGCFCREAAPISCECIALPVFGAAVLKKCGKEQYHDIFRKRDDSEKKKRQIL
jgi:hypothetical protein